MTRSAHTLVWYHAPISDELPLPMTLEDLILNAHSNEKTSWQQVLRGNDAFWYWPLRELVVTQTKKDSAHEQALNRLQQVIVAGTQRCEAFTETIANLRTEKEELHALLSSVKRTVAAWSE